MQKLATTMPLAWHGEESFFLNGHPTNITADRLSGHKHDRNSKNKTKCLQNEKYQNREYQRKKIKNEKSRKKEHFRSEISRRQGCF